MVRQLGVLLPVRLEARHPRLAQLAAARPDAGREVLAHGVGH
jgi:hypothetical protein